MEPIFNDKKYKSNHGVIADCELLRIGTKYFFSHSKNQTLENHFYHFGLLFDSNHFEKNDKWRKEIFTPTRDLFKGVIDHEIIVSVQLGKDLNNEYDEEEADKYDPYYWRIIKATEYNRDDWGYFMFLGNIQGLLNGDKITENKFIAYLNLFPQPFMQKYKEQLQFNLNFFDERGYVFNIENKIELKRIAQGLYQEINQGCI